MSRYCATVYLVLALLVSYVHAEEQVWEHLCATAAAQSDESAAFFAVCEEMRWVPTHHITLHTTPPLPPLAELWDFIARMHLAEILLAHTREQEATEALRLADINTIPDAVLSPREHLVLIARCAYLEAIVAARCGDAERSTRVLVQFEQLVERDSERAIPRRHRDLMKLLAAEFEAAQNATPLDQLANSLDAIRRQLQHGATGQETQQRQQDAIESLKKMIDSLEGELAQQDQPANSTPRDNTAPPTPSPGTIPMPRRGPGTVTDRDLPPGGDWGGLPPKEREEALNKIQREFPANYRDLIEAYFRDMAKESARESVPLPSSKPGSQPSSR